MLGEILSAVGGFLGLASNRDKAEADRRMQYDAAQNQVQWRVADANKAGVHPLAALGMNPVSMAPVAVGDDAGTMSNIGQDVGRAIKAGSTDTQVTNKLGRELALIQLEGARLDNDIKRAELASRVRRTLIAPGTGPVIPEVGPNTARGADIGGQTLPLPVLGNTTTSPTATAEEVERQYGDIAQEVYGTGRLVHDAVQSGFLKRVLSELFGINPAY